jgi:hypothetical protein
MLLHQGHENLYRHQEDQDNYIRLNNVEQGSESEGELENDSDYEPEGESEDDSDNYSDYDCEFEEPLEKVFESKGEIGDPKSSLTPDVLDEDIRSWRRESLQALSGKQIVGMPIIYRLYSRETKANWTAAILRGFEDSGKDHCLTTNTEALEHLTSHLNSVLEPVSSISTSTFREGLANGLMQCALRNAESSGCFGTDAWLCLKYALSYWPGHRCVEVLSSGLMKLTAEERGQMEIDAFAILNKEDQDCELLS